MAKKKELVNRKIAKIKNLFFDDVKALQAVQEITHYEYHYKKDEETDKFVFQEKIAISEEKKVLDFPLREVSREEIKKLRKSKIPSLILKKNGKLYYTELPKGGLLFSQENIPNYKHLCADCARLYALPEKQKGCPKVYYHGSKIEDLKNIIFGFESFNTKHNDCFVVIECSLYSLQKTTKSNLSAAEINALKISLAQELWENVRNFADIEIMRATEQKKKLMLNAEKNSAATKETKTKKEKSN